MHTSGLVVTLSEEPSLAAIALRLLATGPFTLGEVQDNRLPVVMEAIDPNDAHDWHERVERTTGVIGVEVVFVHWEEAESEICHAGD